MLVFSGASNGQRHAASGGTIPYLCTSLYTLLNLEIFSSILFGPLDQPREGVSRRVDYLVMKHLVIRSKLHKAALPVET